MNSARYNSNCNGKVRWGKDEDGVDVEGDGDDDLNDARDDGDDDGDNLPSPEPRTDSRSALHMKNRRW